MNGGKIRNYSITDPVKALNEFVKPETKALFDAEINSFFEAYYQESINFQRNKKVNKLIN